MITAKNRTLLSLTAALILAAPLVAADSAKTGAKTAQTAPADKSKSTAANGDAAPTAADSPDAAKPDSIVSLDLGKNGASVHFNGALSFGKSLFGKILK